MNYLRACVFLISVFLPVVYLTGCHIEGVGNIDQSPHLKCLREIRHGDDFDQKKCAGSEWFKDKRAWIDSSACYERCLSCVFTGIMINATSVSCHERKFLSYCSMGYRPLQ